jgi:hypothetical protein
MLRGFGLVLVVGAFDEFAVEEQGTGADQGDQVGCVDRAPAGLGGFDELEGHGQPGGAGAGALGDLGPVAHGGEGALDGYLEPSNACPAC